MKVKFDGRVPRTSGKNSQPEYDNILADLDISGLKFLIENKQRKIDEYPHTHDLNDQGNAEMFQMMKQQYVMACEEYNNRVADLKASGYSEHRFDSETGLVLDKDGQVLYSIDYSEDEDSYIYRDSTGTVISEIQEEDRNEHKQRTRKEVYKDWDYTA